MSITNNASILIPMGTLMITGNYTQESQGKLELEIRGDTDSDVDHLVVTEKMKLGGTLELTVNSSQLTKFNNFR